MKILADDLTGALDCAAGFTGDGPVTIRWDMQMPESDRFALSTETREFARDEAVARVTHLASALPRDGLLLKKVDSLMRGHVAAEIAAVMEATGLRHAVFAPAFPQQGRITRGGMQYVRGDADPQMIATDVGAELRQRGIKTCADPAGLDAGPCVWIADAETDADLAAIAARGRALPHPVLWCGTAGIAAALAGKAPAVAPPRSGRVLVISGTNHFASVAQVSALADAMPEAVVRSAPWDPPERIVRALDDRALAVMSFDLPTSSREEARGAIATALTRVLPAVTSPDMLVVMGGETLRQCCDALGADALIVDALVEPGIAHARLQGGVWDGARIISKSGAFGDAGTLLRLLDAAPQLRAHALER